MRKFVFLLCLVSALTAAVAQEASAVDPWYVGVGGGYRLGSMSFSDLDDEVFANDRGRLGSGIFSLFVERTFGPTANLGVRGEVAVLRRGGTLDGILDIEDYYELYGIDRFTYSLKAPYLDLRVPVFYQFGTPQSRVRPYVFVAPIFGVPMGGTIRSEQKYVTGRFTGHEVDASDANLNKIYFAASAGVGAKVYFNVEGYKPYLGIEAGYEYGITDTYSKKERDGEAIVLNKQYNTAYDISGKRRFSGVEVKLSLGIPLGVFKKKPVAEPAPIVAPAPAPAPAPVVVPVAKPEKACYTLDEIEERINNGKAVRGLTFCAIDAIQFEFGKSEIKSSSYAYLNQLAQILQKTKLKVQVKGHTDNVGSEAFNLELSKNRALAVLNYLVEHGVPSENLSYAFFGMSNPLESNDTEEGRRVNRRVEFEIMK